LALPIAKLKMLGSPDCVTVIVGMAKQRTSTILGTPQSMKIPLK
jgi:hypothetical protein